MRTKFSVLAIGFMISMVLVGTAEGQLEYRFYWTGADATDNYFTTPGNWDHLNPYGDPLVSPSNFYPRNDITAADSGDPRDDDHSGTRSYVYAYAGATIIFTGFDLPPGASSTEEVRRTYLGAGGGGLGDPAELHVDDHNYVTTDKFFVGDGNETDGADGIIRVNSNGRLTALRDDGTDGGLVLGRNGYDGTLIMNGGSTAELRSVRLGLDDGSVGKI